MAERDARRWNARYEDAPLVVRGAAPIALRDAGMIDLVPTSGRAIDIACGLGEQTLWLAERGLHVMALDVSDRAITNVRDAAERTGLADRISAQTVDLDPDSDLDPGSGSGSGSGSGHDREHDLPPFRSNAEATADIATEIETGADSIGVDVIVCQRFWAPHLFDTIVDGLTPGGLGVITVLSVVGASQPGQFHAPAGELTAGFASERTDIAWHHEGNGEASIVFHRVP